MKLAYRGFVVAAYVVLSIIHSAGVSAQEQRESGTLRDVASPYLKLRPVGSEAVRWGDGFWGRRSRQCVTDILPSMWQVMQLPDNAATFHDLRMAAGLLPAAKPGGTKWSDGDCHKCIETMAHVFAVNHDPKLDQLMDETIEVVRQAQREDGYLSSWVQLKGAARWSDLNNHELYNMGHLMTAACVHHRATGKENYLRIAVRVGDYLYDLFSPRPKELAHFGFNPSNIMGMIDLYRTTGNPKYLELAGIFVDMRGSIPGGSNQNQAAVPLRKEQEAVGHAVTATYLWCGAADVYAETGEKALLASLERLWSDVTAHKMYITGGISALHFGEVTRETFHRWPRDSVHEAFGQSYQLPNRTAYNETCASIGFAMWNWRMLSLTGDARYADMVELALYNSVLSAMSVGGTEFFYTNPLRRCGADTPLMNHDSATRWRDTTPSSPVNCYCCPPNLARTIAQLHGWAYSTSDSAVWVNLLGSNSLNTKLPDGAVVQLNQQTDYPWDGKVAITIDQAPETPLELMVRVPGWAVGAALAINGAPLDNVAQPGAYAAVRRRWSQGDVLELNLPMEVVFMQAHPLVEEARNQLAVMRGPIVYCLESPDLPAGVSIDDLAILPGADWRPQWRPELLGGMSVVEGEAVVREPHDWQGQLYTRWRKYSEQRVPVTLIPYFGWANRGTSQMSVWLPRQDM